MHKIYLVCILNMILLSSEIDIVLAKTQNNHIKIVRCALEKLKEMKIQGQDVFDLLKEDCKKELSDKSKKRNYEDLYLNSKHDFFSFEYPRNKWKISPYKFNPEAEFNLIHYKQQGFLMIFVVPQKSKLPYKILKNIVLNHISNFDPNYTIIKDEIILIDNEKWILIELNASVNINKNLKDKFRYKILLWSGDPGNVAIYAYTYDELYNEYKNDFKSIQNGIIIRNTGF